MAKRLRTRRECLSDSLVLIEANRRGIKSHMVYLRNFAKKNKRVTFCGSLDYQGASTNLIITLRGEGCHPLSVKC